jgi:hypothetical protein
MGLAKIVSAGPSVAGDFHRPPIMRQEVLMRTFPNLAARIRRLAPGLLVLATVGLAQDAFPVDRTNPQQRFGGPWLDVRGAACVPAPPGMIAWYRFDETTGTVANDFPNVGPPGPAALIGGPAHVPGRVAHGLSFDGIDDYAEDGPAKNVGTGDFSVDMWIKVAPGHAAVQRVILDKRTTAQGPRGYHLILNNGSPLLQMADGGWTNYPSNLPSIADGNWHFLAVTVRRGSSTGIRWYLDGVSSQQGNPTLRMGTLSTDARLRIGRRSAGMAGGEGWFRGVLDELEIFNRVLTTAELNGIYQAGPAGKCR